MVCKVESIRSVKFKMSDGAEKILTNVRFVIDLKRNLISLGELEATGYQFKAEDVTIKVSKGTRQNGLYLLQGFALPGEDNVAAAESDKTRLWHQRLRHISERGLQELGEQELFRKDKIDNLEFCEHCIFEKKKCRVKFKAVTHTSKTKLDYIRSDLWGTTVKIHSYGGNRYFLTLIDDCSRKVWIHLLKSKDETFQNFKQWKAMVENQTDKRVKVLRTYNGLVMSSIHIAKTME